MYNNASSCKNLEWSGKFIYLLQLRLSDLGTFQISTPLGPSSTSWPLSAILHWKYNFKNFYLRFKLFIKRKKTQQQITNYRICDDDISATIQYVCHIIRKNPWPYLKSKHCYIYCLLLINLRKFVSPSPVKAKWQWITLINIGFYVKQITSCHVLTVDSIYHINHAWSVHLVITSFLSQKRVLLDDNLLLW